MRIIGIDPGTNVMGHAVIEVKDKRVMLMEMGVEKFNARQNHYVRLGKIFECAQGLIKLYQPDILSIEAPFYGKNVNAMLRLGRGQGVAILSAILGKAEVVEYEPRSIKKAITGNGGASKEQVRQMLTHQILIPSQMLSELELDATDALAAAMCHYYTLQSPIAVTGSNSTPRKASRSWSSYVTEHSDKIVKNL